MARILIESCEFDLHLANELLGEQIIHDGTSNFLASMLLNDGY